LCHAKRDKKSDFKEKINKIIQCTGKEFEDWEDSYNELPRWYQVVQESNPDTIIQCTRHPVVVSGPPDLSCYIMERVFWSFRPCIQGFNYCKQLSK